MSLIGSFVYMSSEDRWSTGQIIDEPTPGYFVIKIDFDDFPDLCVLKHAAELAAVDIDDPLQNKWFFFDSRERLQAFIAWTEDTKDDTLKIVPFRGKDDKQTTNQTSTKHSPDNAN